MIQSTLLNPDPLKGDFWINDILSQGTVFFMCKIDPLIGTFPSDKQDFFLAKLTNFSQFPNKNGKKVNCDAIKQNESEVEKFNFCFLALPIRISFKL